MAFRLSLLGSDGRQLAESTGSLNRLGTAAPDFTSQDIPAADVGNMAISLTAGRLATFR